MAFDPNAAAAPDSGIFGLDSVPDDARVLLVPVPWDATTSYRAGTSRGPAAILSASKQVDLFDVETGKPYEAGIALLEEGEEIANWNKAARAAAVPVIESGGRADGDAKLEELRAIVNEFGERVNAHVYQRVAEWIDRGRLVGVVGGDHAVPFGAIRAHAERTPGLGILHVDAHADLRRAYEGFEWSHASIMENVTRRLDGVAKLVQVGIRDLCEEEYERIRSSRGRIVTHFDPELAEARRRGALDKRFAEIARSLPRKVYVSFDIDGLDPVLCPSTGTPVPGGLAFHEASALLRAVVAAGRTIVGFDLNEVAPAPDDADEWDGNVGARVLYKLIGWSLLSHGIGRPTGTLAKSQRRRAAPARPPRRKLQKAPRAPAGRPKR
jgi:agmatinase